MQKDMLLRFSRPYLFKKNISRSSCNSVYETFGLGIVLK